MIAALCFSMVGVGLGASLACQARDGLASAVDQEQVRTCRSGVLLGWLFILCVPAASFAIRGS